MLSGDSTYTIGGKFSDNLGNSGSGRNPISELKWPLDVVMVSLGGQAKLGRFSVRGEIMKNATNDAGDLEDSAWGVYYGATSRATSPRRSGSGCTSSRSRWSGWVGLLGMSARKTYSPQEAAEALGVTRPTIWKLARLGEIPYRRLGRLVLIDREEFDKWYKSLPGKSADQVIQGAKHHA